MIYRTAVPDGRAGRSWLRAYSFASGISCIRCIRRLIDHELNHVPTQRAVGVRVAAVPSADVKRGRDSRMCKTVDDDVAFHLGFCFKKKKTCKRNKVKKLGPPLALICVLDVASGSRNDVIGSWTRELDPGESINNLHSRSDLSNRATSCATSATASPTPSRSVAPVASQWLSPRVGRVHVVSVSNSIGALGPDSDPIYTQSRISNLAVFDCLNLPYLGTGRPDTGSSMYHDVELG